MVQKKKINSVFFLCNSFVRPTLQWSDCSVLAKLEISRWRFRVDGPRRWCGVGVEQAIRSTEGALQSTLTALGTGTVTEPPSRRPKAKLRSTHE